MGTKRCLLRAGELPRWPGPLPPWGSTSAGLPGAALACRRAWARRN